jgi:hypothetical protein
MSLDITQFYPTEFERNWTHVAQQMDCRLRLAVMPGGNLTGKRKSFNLLNDYEMDEVTTRKGDTPDGDTSGEKYWLYARKFEKVISFDEDDERQLGQIVLPDSDEVRNMAMAYNRKVDDMIIGAFDATRYIGEDGTSTDAFPGSQSIAVDYVPTGAPANSGLTFAKIREAARILNVNEVPESERFFSYGAKQLDNLLAITEATSRDYSDLMALKDGKISYWMGFTWIPTQRLSRNVATDVRSCFAWHKSGIKLGEGARNSYIDVRPDKRHAKQIRSVGRLGAVRSENEKVVRVYCDESP